MIEHVAQMTLRIQGIEFANRFLLRDLTYSVQADVPQRLSVSPLQSPALPF